MEPDKRAEEEPKIPADLNDGEAWARWRFEVERLEAAASWKGFVGGEPEGSSGETMTMTLDPVLTQRMKAVARKFGKSAEEFLLPHLHLLTQGDVCYPLGEWQRPPGSRVHTVEEIDRLKEMW